MFAYCNNNPIMFSDSNGARPIASTSVSNETAAERSISCQAMRGTYFYSSAEEAAKAFSEQVYSSSLYIRHEYATEIYSRTFNGVTLYSYNPPRAHNPHSASVGYRTPKGTKIVAYAHTHPNSNEFSEEDIIAAQYLRIDAYVVGPNLELQWYSLFYASVTGCGIISPIALTDAERFSLMVEFQVSWDAHVDSGCDFNCGNKTWPTP